MTEDEINQAAEDAFSDTCEGEPPISMDERHRMNADLDTVIQELRKQYD